MELTNPTNVQTNLNNQQPWVGNPYQSAQSQSQPPTPQGAQLDYAGFWLRYLAQMVDSAIWSLNFFMPLYLLSALGTANVEVFVPGFLWFILYILMAGPLIKFFVHPWLISHTGAGLGKMICGMEIINQDESRLTYKNAVFREYIAKIASNALLGLGYYWIFRNPQRQGWHDGLAGTYVIKKHNGALTGLMALIIMIVMIFGLGYKAFDNFRNAKTLQYDIMTLVTQVQQDFTETLAPKTPSTSFDSGSDKKDWQVEFDDSWILKDDGNQINYGDYEKYQNMSYDELLKELEKLNTQ